MNISIKMIGIATTLFWIFLIAFSVSVAYSAKDFQFNFGETRMTVDANDEAVLSTPITLTNRGFYDVSPFIVTSKVTDRDGYEITQGNTVVPIIKKGERIDAFHNLILNITELLQEHQDYAFNDTEFTIHESVDLTLAQFVPVKASTNFTTHWGAPLHNFKVGEPQYSTFNLTHLRVTVPVSFENNAPFNFSGKLDIRMYNNSNLLIGNGQNEIEAFQRSPFNGIMEFYPQIGSMTPDGTFEIYLNTPLFDWGPWVTSYG
jgi:hypothetical protein